MTNLKSFQNLRIKPAVNPAVLDTDTWDPGAAWPAVAGIAENWSVAQAALSSGNPWAGPPEFPVSVSSVVHRGAAKFFLAGLPDGQHVFVELGQGGGASA